MGERIIVNTAPARRRDKLVANLAAECAYLESANAELKRVMRELVDMEYWWNNINPDELIQSKFEWDAAIAAARKLLNEAKGE